MNENNTKNLNKYIRDLERKNANLEKELEKEQNEKIIVIQEKKKLEKENKELSRINKKLKWSLIDPSKPGPTALFENKKDKKIVEELIHAYSTGNTKQRKKFDKLKI